MRPITVAEVAAWRKAYTTDGADGDPAARWRDLNDRRPTSARAIIDYHDLLLFILAFPRSAEDHARAERELERIAALVTAMVDRDAHMARALSNSGITGTSSTAVFTIDLVRWLVQTFPQQAELDSLDGPEDQVRELITALAPPTQREAMENERFKPMNRLRAIAPQGTARWLINALDEQIAHPALRRTLWSVLSPYVSIQAGRSMLSRTNCRAPEAPVHPFSDGFRYSVDVARLIAKPLPAPKPLKALAREQLVMAARGVLIGHLRETDTATFCEAGTLEWHQMGQGIGMLLLPLPPGQRTPFDSYVGYVAFANGVPVAYGGAWIFPGRSKVGINVFPSFRGGPSMLLFAQILRCYAQRFRVGCFEAEDYQLGHRNSDGLRSGAYWFYYRMGFRTVDPVNALLAEREFERLQKDRAYRTPLPMLRKLVAEPMLAVVKVDAAPEVDLLALSEAILRSGPSHSSLPSLRRILGVEDMRRWPVAEQRAFEDLAPAMSIIPDLVQWTQREKQQLVRLMRAKGQRTEDKYIDLLRTHRRLLTAWAALSRSAER